MEKEALSIVFACKKYHDYIYGRHFIVENDHKPLQSIFLKSINRASPRIQRFMLYLQRYDFTVNYIPGKQMIVADTLSRAPLKSTEPELSKIEINSHIHSVKSQLPISERKLEQISVETKKDPTLRQIVEYIQNQWPSKRSEVTNDVKPFYNIKNELTMINDLVYKSSRIVIPRSMRKEIKSKLHIGHLGIEIMRLRARDCVYWPGIDSEIEDLVSNCSSCLEYRNRIPKESLIEHDIPIKPWSKVGTDVFHLFRKHYVLVVD